MTRKGIRAITAAACIGFGLIAVGPGQAVAQSDQWNALYDRIIRVEHEMRELRAGAGVAGGAGQAVDGGQRLGSIENQLRMMTAQLDEVRRAQQSIELRLDRLEGRTGTTGTIFDQQQVSPPGQNGPEFDLSQYQTGELAELSAQQDVTIESYREPQPYGASAAYQAPETYAPAEAAPATAPGPQVLGTLRSQSPYDPGQYASGGAPRAVGGSLVPESVEQASLDSPSLQSAGGSGPDDSLYAKAYDSLLGRRFGDAEAGFKQFLSRNGNHPLAGDAQYWLGETYYVQGDYKQAAQSFLKGYREYPKSRKAPDTLFKLALSLKQLKQTQQACSTFAEVAKTYPTAAEIRNAALKEMKRAGC